MKATKKKYKNERENIVDQKMVGQWKNKRKRMHEIIVIELF